MYVSHTNNTHTHTHTYVFMFLFIYVCVFTYVYTMMCVQVLTLLGLVTSMVDLFDQWETMGAPFDCDPMS
jgi:hypothetical protein